MFRNTMEPPVCKNIRSRKHPDQRCSNPATNGEYCGVHFKHPRPFALRNGKQMDNVIDLYIPVEPNLYIKKIQSWWKRKSGLIQWRRQGPAIFMPEICTNTSDFFSMDDIINIPKHMRFSYVDSDKMVYAFDIRSLSTLIEKHIDTEIQNPYNRQPISEKVLTRAMRFIRWCRRKNIDTRWVTTEPDTPDQRFQLKVTDLFQKIDELGYYTNPQWYICLNVRCLRRFYVELYDIWYHRAGLNSDMRNIIIPYPARPFRYTLKEIIGSRNLEFLRKATLELIRMFISAAAENSDKSTGAMYVLTAMTLVNKECSESYPWLYESAVPGIYSQYEHLEEVTLPIFGFNYMNTLFAGNQMLLPFLALPPPAQNGNFQNE